jgi:dienelactone hydrolase
MKRSIIISIIIVIIIALIIGGYFYYKSINSVKLDKVIYELRGDTLYYSQNRGIVDYSKSLQSSNDSFDTYNINFQGRAFMKHPLRFYGLLYMPKNKKNVPGVVFLPGGGVIKENAASTAIKICEMGYAVLVIDQRGLGQTKGQYLNIKDDYMVFLKGEEPIQHLSVYDALKAFDVLRAINGVDKNNIAIYGESMGSRYGIIATALDNRIKGMVAVSTSGFNITHEDNSQAENYLMSIDPDHYIDKISPRPIIMIHGTNDSVVNISDARRTFAKAFDPKEFHVAEGCQHGYCDKMYDFIKEGFKRIFGK